MRRFVFAGMVFVLLTGCTTRVVEVQVTSPPTEAPETNPPTTPAPPSRSTDRYSTSVEQELLEMVYEMTPDARYWDMENDIIDSAQLTCTSLDTGISIYEIAATSASAAGGDQDTMEFLAGVVVSAIMVMCPEYTYALEQLGDY